MRMTLQDYRLTEPIRIINDTDDMTDSSGNTWTGFPFGIRLPSSSDEFRSIKVTIQNINQVVGNFVLKANKSPTLTLELVEKSDPDNPILTAADLRLTGVEVTDISVSGNIVSKIDPNDPWPANTADSVKYPLIFK